MNMIPTNILAPGSYNQKLNKSEAFGYMTYCLYLEPHIEGYTGFNSCPYSTPECRAYCLGKNSGFQYSVQHRRNRQKHTILKVLQPKYFWHAIEEDVIIAKRNADSKRLKLAIRLGALGEPYVTYCKEGRELVRFCQKEDIVLYDYTKDYSRLIKVTRHYPGYYLVFSCAKVFGCKRRAWSPEAIQNEVSAKMALAQGYMVACIFVGDLPETHWGYPVVDGDAHDLVFLHLEGKRKRAVVLGLRLKGKKQI
jgi:hypothetical protein